MKTKKMITATIIIAISFIILATMSEIVFGASANNRWKYKIVGNELKNSSVSLTRSPASLFPELGRQGLTNFYGRESKRVGVIAVKTKKSGKKTFLTKKNALNAGEKYAYRVLMKKCNVKGSVSLYRKKNGKWMKVTKRAVNPIRCTGVDFSINGKNYKGRMCSYKYEQNALCGPLRKSTNYKVIYRWKTEKYTKVFKTPKKDIGFYSVNLRRA